MNGKAILADEVGLGKTVEAGLILKEYMIRGLAKNFDPCARFPCVTVGQRASGKIFDSGC